MVRVIDKGSKLENEYEGPYLIVRKNHGGSYMLKDKMGNLKPSNYPPNHLKLISQDEVVPCGELYKVKAIVAHYEIEPSIYEYKVQVFELDSVHLDIIIVFLNKNNRVFEQE